MKAVIFDLDGVLVHTDQFHRQAWEALARRLGVTLRPEVSRSMLGVSRMDSLELLLTDAGLTLSQAEKESLAEEKNQTYRRLIASMTPADVSREVRDTLEALRRMDLRLAVGSSSKNARTILERVELETSFDAVADGTMICRSKPDPEVFQKAAELLGTSPRETLVVEDAEAGIQAAKAGGFWAAGVGPAAASPLADWRLEKLSQLTDCLRAGEAAASHRPQSR